MATKELPTKVKIGDDLYKRLMIQQDNIVSCQSSMEMFQRNIEARIAEHQAKTREIWAEIAKEHPELDFQNVAYAPGKEPGHIIPVQMKLADA